jgi:hypothetical protein
MVVQIPRSPRAAGHPKGPKKSRLFFMKKQKTSLFQKGQKGAKSHQKVPKKCVKNANPHGTEG